MTKSVLLVNRYACSNLGDQEIANCYENFLHENYDVEVFRADYTSRQVNSLKIHSALRLKPLKNLIKKFISPRIVWTPNFFRIFFKIKKSRADLVLIGGGQLIMPGVFSLAAFTWVLVSKLCRRKVVMANVGAGGDFDVVDRWLLSWAMHWLDGVSFRDKNSLKVVSSLCRQKKPTFVSTFDIVFTKNIEQEFDSPRNNLAVAVTSWDVFKLNGGSGNRQEYFENWMSLLVNDRRPSDKVLLVYATAEDYKETLLFNQFVLENYNCSFEVALIENVIDLRNILSTSRLLISGRMHSLLFGAQCNCSLRPFIISDKINSFYSDLLNFGLDSLKKKAFLSSQDFLNPFLNT